MSFQQPRLLTLIVGIYLIHHTDEYTSAVTLHDSQLKKNLLETLVFEAFPFELLMNQLKDGYVVMSSVQQVL